MTILHVQNLSKNVYDQQVLQNITLQLKQREVIWIQAKQGGGKTLLANIFATVEKADGGSLMWQGTGTRKFGAIFDTPAIISNLTIAQNLSLVLDHFTGPEDLTSRRQTIQNLLQDWQLIHCIDLRPVALSKSQLMQIAVIRAMLAGPDALIWDDAFEAFDEGLQQFIWQKMKTSISNGCGSIFFSRRAPFFNDVTVSLLQLENGRLVA